MLRHPFITGFTTIAVVAITAGGAYGISELAKAGTAMLSTTLASRTVTQTLYPSTPTVTTRDTFPQSFTNNNVKAFDSNGQIQSSINISRRGNSGEITVIANFIDVDFWSEEYLTLIDPNGKHHDLVNSDDLNYDFSYTYFETKNLTCELNLNGVDSYGDWVLKLDSAVLDR